MLSDPDPDAPPCLCCGQYREGHPYQSTPMCARCLRLGCTTQGAMCYPLIYQYHTYWQLNARAPNLKGVEMAIRSEWAGWVYDPNQGHDKIWAAAYTDGGYYLTVFGRRDTAYQSLTRVFPLEATARAWYERKVVEKQREGYAPIPFADPAAGNIPRFPGRVPPAPAGQPVPRWLHRAANLREALGLHLVGGAPSLRTILAGYRDLRVRSDLLLAASATTPAEREQIAVALADLDPRVRALLTGD